MYSLSKIPLLLVFLAWLASADDNIFVFPDENSTITPEWVLGETQEIKWNTTYDMVDFGFNAADTATVVWVVENIKKPQTSYNWTLNTNNSASPTNTQVFYLVLRDSNNSSSIILSQAVVISPEPLGQSAAPTKIPSATSTRIEYIYVTQTNTVMPTTTSSSATTTTASDIAPSAASGNAATTSSPGLSTGAQVGIGVGVALAVLAAAALVVLTIWRRRRWQAAPSLAQPPEELESPTRPIQEYYNDGKLVSPLGSEPNGAVQSGRAAAPVEMQGAEVARELRGPEVAKEVVGTPATNGFRVER